MIDFFKKHPGWAALISLGAIGGTLWGLNRVLKLEGPHLAPLRERFKRVSSKLRYNERLRRWQDDRGRFVKVAG